MSQQRLLQQLEDTKEQLKKQKTLKEMYIRRGEETTRELERLRKSSNDVKLSNAKIATQERDNTRQKKKKDLHKDHEELQVAHLITEEKNQADLQAEKHKNKLLLDELDQISVSHNEIRLSYQTDVMKVRQQLDTLQHDLVKEMQQRTTVEKQNAQLQMAHVLSQDNFTAELQVEEQKNKLLQEELDKISHGLSEHLCFRCPPSSVWLQCHRQSAPSLRQARGADSRGGTVCHICYSCHQLQEAPHKWSGLRSSRGRPVSSHRNVQVTTVERRSCGSGSTWRCLSLLSRPPGSTHFTYIMICSFFFFFSVANFPHSNQWTKERGCRSLYGLCSLLRECDYELGLYK
ncbi:uncharacterized protein LOC119016839 isoform X3 [Acanthopagrus latus]|uniref:uncharacterized protein LOC119016839 isoform X3 n=1 Tax=Acanthopagrus latus TaxID=8177 RepID=UPI00187D0BE3|nr:uncharacterized protein LOC119016839 isoform X3 [Acanthopagrus latus]